MIDIRDHKADPMLSEFVERRGTGTPIPLDRANAALARASQAATIFSNGDECDDSSIGGMRERVELAARACGIATRRGEPDIAELFAKAAEQEAVVLDSYDSARLDGLPRPQIFEGRHA